jgi:hypothetical protein
MKKNVRPWALAAALIPLAFALTGCFGGPNIPNVPNIPGADGGSEEVNDELVEDIVEGSGEGEVDFESGSLPSDFPVDDVPLVEGEIGPSMSISNGQAWTVTIFTADEATAKSAPALLEAAGFSNESGIFWETSEYIVILVATDEGEDGRWYVYYQVQTQS